MSEWRKYKLEEVVRLKRGFDLATPKRRPGPFPVVGSAGISGWHDEGPVVGPAVVLGRAGSSMGVASYCDVDRFWPLNTSLFVEDFHGNDPRFVFYLFKITDLTGFDSGSAQPMLNRNYIRNVSVKIPDPAEQRLISGVLRALDDKIATNHRIAETARMLALSRFGAAIRNCETEQHELTAISEVLSRGIAPRYTDDPTQLLVLNQKCIRNGRVSIAPSRRTQQKAVPSQKLLQPNDILVNSTGVGTLGRVAVWRDTRHATVDSHVTIVRIDPNKADPACVGFAMLAAQEVVASLGEGSTGQTELSRTRLGTLTLAIPDLTSARCLHPLLDSLEAQGETSLNESVALAELRDALLPKLMSGEIQVREAERIVEDAT